MAEGKRVFFAFLGASSYVPVYYGRGDTTSSQPETYVQAAMLELLSREGRRPDRVVIAITEGAANQHRTHLEARLAELGFACEFVPIPEGRSEDELWAVFNKLATALGVGSLVHFDLTHGYRSLPATAVMALGFLRHANGIVVEGLHYGAFESLLNRDDLPEAPGRRFKRAEELGAWQKESGRSLRAPIFDLTAMFDLPAWSEGLAEWNRTGRADGLVERTRPYLDALKKQMRDGAPKALCSLPARLQGLSDAVTLVRHDQFGTQATMLAESLDAAERELANHAALAPLRLVFEAIGESTQILAEKDCAWRRTEDSYLASQLRVAAWMVSRGRVVEALTVLRELQSSCAVRIGIEAGVERLAISDERSTRGDAGDKQKAPGVTPDDARYRKDLEWFVSSIVGIVGSPKRPRHPDASAVARVTRWLGANPAVTAAFKAADVGLREHRNRLNHAWTGNEHTKTTFNKNSLDEMEKHAAAAHACMTGLVSAVTHGATAPEVVDPPPFFANLSNHPVSSWTDTQRETALALNFGAPMDLPDLVSEIPPDDAMTSVSARAARVADEVVARGARGAFVAGEFTYTVALVRELQSLGVRCFAATTRREVSTKILDDERIETLHTFCFVRWREYS
jgi:hypothetical protein